MLSKLVAFAETREMAIDRMLRALEEYVIGGIKTNIGLFRRILTDADFRAARIDTGYLERLLAAGPAGGSRGCSGGCGCAGGCDLFCDGDSQWRAPCAMLPRRAGGLRRGGGRVCGVTVWLEIGGKKRAGGAAGGGGCRCDGVRWECLVDGRAVSADVRLLEPGVMSLIVDGAAVPVRSGWGWRGDWRAAVWVCGG